MESSGSTDFPVSSRDVLELARKLTSPAERNARLLLERFALAAATGRPVEVQTQSQAMRSTLRSLTLDGLLDRQVDTAQEPVREFYELTPLGEDVLLLSRRMAAAEAAKATEHDVILHPFVTEKTMGDLERQNKLEFVVRDRAGKPAIRKAIERLLNAKVTGVQIRRTEEGVKHAIVEFEESPGYGFTLPFTPRPREGFRKES